MRDISTNRTCYNCDNCLNRLGTSHGFCKKNNEPVGGLEPSFDFDEFFAHIVPQWTMACEDFTPQRRFALRSKVGVLYFSCVEGLSRAFSDLKGVET